MTAVMCYDNRKSTGWCIIEEIDELPLGDKLSGRFHVMYVTEDNQWYPYGWMPNYLKALKRLEQYEEEDRNANRS
jgi:hypothetical protein